MNMSCLDKLTAEAKEYLRALGNTGIRKPESRKAEKPKSRKAEKPKPRKKIFFCEKNKNPRN